MAPIDLIVVEIVVENTAKFYLKNVHKENETE